MEPNPHIREPPYITPPQNLPRLDLDFTPQNLPRLDFTQLQSLLADIDA